MSDVIDTFRVQFDALITEIKQDLCREVDAKANGLFGLLQGELRRQMQSTGDQVVAENDENNGNTGDDTVPGHVKVEDDSMESECECDSESEWDTDEDIEVKKEEPEDDDSGEHDAVNDNERMGNDETEDPIETNQAVFDEEDVVTNSVDGNESAVDQEDGNGDEQDEQTDVAAGSGNDASSTQSAPVPNEPILQVASTSGLRRSNCPSIKRRQIISENVTSLDEEDAESENNQAGPKRKNARVKAAPVVPDRPRQEATVDQEDSKNIITRSINCTVTGCTKEFRDKTQLIEHLKRKHRIDRYPCHVRGCTVSFTTRHKLSEHLRSAHGSLTRWPCGHCALQCSSYRHLYIHVWNYHELGRFVCGHAGCDFPASTYRKKVFDHQMQHKPATHQCTFTGCGKAFKLSADLKRHLLTHTGERPFVCDHCQKTFALKENLNRHVRSQHTHIGERPFVCDQCQKAFSAKSSLRRHVHSQH